MLSEVESVATCMVLGKSQIPSYQLVDPTWGSPFTESDYFDPLNNETPYRIADYSYRELTHDFYNLFPSSGLDLEQIDFEKYFRWWMEKRVDVVLKEDPDFYDPVSANQWKGNWELNPPYSFDQVTIQTKQETKKLTKKEFDRILRQKGEYPLGSLLIRSWDEILEIAATHPDPNPNLGDVYLGFPTVITQERIERYQKQREEGACSYPEPLREPYQNSELTQFEVSFLFRAKEALRQKIKSTVLGDAFVSFKKGATIRAHFDMKDRQVNLKNGSSLLLFEGVSVSFKRSALTSTFLGPLLAPLLSFKESVEVPIQSITVFGGRPYLALDFSNLPIIGRFSSLPVFVEISLLAGLAPPMPKNPLTDFAVNPARRLQRDLTSESLLESLDKILGSTKKADLPTGPFFDLVPSFYEGTLWVRGLSGHYRFNPPDPLLGNLVELQEGALKINFDETGMTQVEGRLPLTLEENKNPQLQIPIYFRARMDEEKKCQGWITGHSESLPDVLAPYFKSGGLDLIFSDTKLNPDAEKLEAFIGKAITQFQIGLNRREEAPFVLQGGLVYMGTDKTYRGFGELGLNQLPDFPKIYFQSGWEIKGHRADRLGDFQFEGLTLELMRGLSFQIDEVSGSYAKNDKELFLKVKAHFHLKAHGTFWADQVIAYTGEIIWNREKKTITLNHLSLPVSDMMMSMYSDATVYPFIFSGIITGSPIFDFEKRELRGPLTLKGDVRYLRGLERRGFPFFPSWLKLNHSAGFSIPFSGVVYRPNDEQRLARAAEQIAQDPGGDQVQSLKGVCIQIQKVYPGMEKGSIEADFKISASKVVSVPGMFPPTPIRETADPIPILRQAPDRAEEKEAPPWILHQEEILLDEWDLHLNQFGLDRESAKALLGLSPDIQEASWTVDGIQIHLPPSHIFFVGPIPIRFPKGSVPVLDVRVVNGRLERFHLYFTRPLELLPGIPLIRGFYFDKQGGQFRLDLINDKEDLERSVEFYKVTRNDWVVTKALFKLLPFSQKLIDDLLQKSRLNTDFLGDAAHGWLQFMILSLVALGKKNIEELGERPAQKSVVDWSEAEVTIQSLQFNPKAHFKWGGVEFRINPLPLSEPEIVGNLMNGVFSLKEGSFRFSVENLSQLQVIIPNGDPNLFPFNILLSGGSKGELVFGKEKEASFFSLENMNFKKVSFRGSFAHQSMDIPSARNLFIRELTVKKGLGDEGDLTTLSANLDMEVDQMTLAHQENGNTADIEIIDSPVHIEAIVNLEEKITGGSMGRSVSTTIFNSGKLTVTSERLTMPRMTYTPGVSFAPSRIAQARLILESYGGSPEFHIEGDLDLQLKDPLEIPLAQARLLPRINSQLRLDRLSILGYGILDFKDKIFFVSVPKKGKAKYTPLKMTYSGDYSLNYTPLADHPDQVTQITGRFSGSHELVSGVLTLEEREGAYSFHLKKGQLAQWRLHLEDLNGTFYISSPTSYGVSKVKITDGFGFLELDNILIREGGMTRLKGFKMLLTDLGPHRNLASFKGDLALFPMQIRLGAFRLGAHFYDESNKISLSGISIVSFEPQESR